MAWFRTWRRKHKHLELHIAAYKRFDGMTVTNIDHIVYHGDSRDYATITAANGLKRYISNNALPKPAIMDGGGTRNTVTTTKFPEVAASYAARGGAAHTVKSENRYIYAILLPSGEGIDLVANLPQGEGAGQMSANNARTNEFLTLDVNLGQILGCVTTAKSAVGGQVAVTAAYHVLNQLPPGTTVANDEQLIFAAFQIADQFAIQAV